MALDRESAERRRRRAVAVGRAAARQSYSRRCPIARTHFIDACASAWIDGGELVHIEDLVLHDASMDIRSPTRELTRTHVVLRARRRILLEAPQWALSPSGLNALIGGERPYPRLERGRVRCQAGRKWSIDSTRRS